MKNITDVFLEGVHPVEPELDSNRMRKHFPSHTQLIRDGMQERDPPSRVPGSPFSESTEKYGCP